MNGEGKRFVEGSARFEKGDAKKTAALAWNGGKGKAGKRRLVPLRRIQEEYAKKERSMKRAGRDLI